jgi:hypothetical protein
MKSKESRLPAASVMSWLSAGCIAALAPCLVLSPARAQDDTEFREIETKYIFGFTSGSGIGLQGEKEFSIETIGRFGKRDGRYAATETRFEVEHTPTQFIQIEFGALASTHHISGVTGLEDRRAINASGLFGEIRYLLLERGASPLSLTLSVEPTFRRIDETGGEPVSNFELEAKISGDIELVKNRLFLGFNLLYEPEWTRTPEGELEKEANLGVSAALAFRLTPALTVGAELGYFRHYEGVGLEHFEGDAWYLGPTLYYQLTRKSFMTAAWATQIAGSSVDDPAPLNLAEFTRHRGKLKFAFEF